jgi:hypothetical protein
MTDSTEYTTERPITWGFVHDRSWVGASFEDIRTRSSFVWWNWAAFSSCHDVCKHNRSFKGRGARASSMFHPYTYAAKSGGHLIRPYFFDAGVNNAAYLIVLQIWFVPQLREVSRQQPCCNKVVHQHVMPSELENILTDSADSGSDLVCPPRSRD